MRLLCDPLPYSSHYTLNDVTSWSSASCRSCVCSLGLGHGGRGTWKWTISHTLFAARCVTSGINRDTSKKTLFVKSKHLRGHTLVQPTTAFRFDNSVSSSICINRWADSANGIRSRRVVMVSVPEITVIVLLLVSSTLSQERPNQSASNLFKFRFF